jgi:glycosyltransferase involved in cell wall biosynthesis
MENLKRTAFRLGMERAVIFSGPVPRGDVPAYIDAMDICVLPNSNAFGSPIALFEFMAMGKPCVVPDFGPMRDVIDDDMTGILFPRGDFGALQKALVRVIEDPALRTQLGVRARDTVLQHHTWSANARIVIQLAAGKSSARPFAHLKQLDCDTQ